MKEFRIDRHHAGKRLDRFMEEIEHWPHGMVVKAIRMKKLKVNGKRKTERIGSVKETGWFPMSFRKKKGAISRLCMKMSTY